MEFSFSEELLEIKRIVREFAEKRSEAGAGKREPERKPPPKSVETELNTIANETYKN